MAKRKSALSRTAAIVVIIIIAVAAIGGGFVYYQQTQSSTSTSSTTTSSVTTSSTTPGVTCPIIIGGTLSFTGAYSTYGIRQNVTMHMAVDELNKEGGLLGCQVKLIIYDDQSDVKTIYNDYLRLITVDHAQLLIGSVISALGQAISPLFEQYKIPVVHPAVAALLPHLNYSFSLLPYAGNYTTAYLNYMATKAQGAKIAIISDSTAFPLGVAKGADAYSNKTGFNVVDFEQFSPQTTDFTGLLNKLKSLNPDIVLATGYVNEAVQITKDMHGIGWTPKAFFFTTGPSLPQYINSTGTLANGAWTVSPWMPYPYLKAPGVQNVTAQFEAATNSAPDYTAVANYVSIMLTAQAVKSVGSLNYPAITNYLLHVNTVIDGWKISFDQASHQNSAGMQTIQIQNGTWVIVTPSELATGSGQYPCPCS